jgi:hypothetical protein
MKALATISALAVLATGASAQSLSTFTQGGKTLEVITYPAKVWHTPLKNLTFNLDTLAGVAGATEGAFGFAVDAHVALKSYADFVFGIGLPVPLSKFQIEDVDVKRLGLVVGLGVKF